MTDLARLSLHTTRPSSPARTWYTSMIRANDWPMACRYNFAFNQNHVTNWYLSINDGPFVALRLLRKAFLHPSEEFLLQFHNLLPSEESVHWYIGQWSLQRADDRSRRNEVAWR